MELKAKLEEWELKQPFRISGREFNSAMALVVEISDGKFLGRGEAQGVYYLGETGDSMMGQVEQVADDIRSGAGRLELLDLLPAGGARNAIDCALWELEAKQSSKTIWQLTGIEPKPVTTVYTIGIEASPHAMAEKAAAASDYPILKIKLDGEQSHERLAAIRAARPKAKLVVDANQGWSFALLTELMSVLVDLNLSMIEQPLPRGADEALEGFKSPIPLAADESCLHTGELDKAATRYDMINIKLDKTGGLTEALRLAKAAKEKGCTVMVGNMMGTSLAMAPSFVVAQLCDFVDIDGPLLLKCDRPNGLLYESGRVGVFSSTLWG